MDGSRIRVVVGAANAVTAKQLSRDLSADAGLAPQSVTTAGQLFDAITLARPSVILLDTNLAGATTPQLIEGLSRQREIPVILRADHTDGNDLLLDCLDAGALSISTRPRTQGETAALNANLIWTLRSAAAATVQKLGVSNRFDKLATTTGNGCMLAFGGGLGSLPALSGIMAQLPSDAPGGVAIAPLPGYLVKAWAERISSRSDVQVKPATHRDLIQRGQILIAPGDAHMTVQQTPGGLAIVIKDGPAVLHHKPSVEVLFNSLAENAGESTIAALLSGGGDDGVAGLLNLRNHGGRTIIQSPATCLCPDAANRAQRCRAGEFCVDAPDIARQMLDLSAQLSLPRAA
jgi:two-component system chemotaxis response regulator CheB